jgi:hypothetical protein
METSTSFTDLSLPRQTGVSLRPHTQISRIKAIPENDVKNPNMPGGKAIQEVEDLTAW